MKKTKKSKKAKETPKVEEKHQISPSSISFGQEDLNKVVEKINEIIAHLNKVI